jgi:hypothetical protein
LLAWLDLLDFDAALDRLDARLADADRPLEVDLLPEPDLLPLDLPELVDRLELDLPLLPDPLLDADLPPERVVFVSLFAIWITPRCNDAPTRVCIEGSLPTQESGAKAVRERLGEEFARGTRGHVGSDLGRECRRKQSHVKAMRPLFQAILTRFPS